MTKRKVIELATKVAKCCGLRLKRTDLVLKKMRGQFPVTTIIKNEDYILWVDRHYIAVGGNLLNSFIYIYITNHHLLEEIREVIRLREKSEYHEDYEFYSLIIKQLLHAQKIIKENSGNYFLLENYLPKIRGLANE